MASSKVDLVMPKRETDTSDEMVKDSETKPDLATEGNGASKIEIQSDTSNRDSDSDSAVEDSKYEFLQFQVCWFFTLYPETEEEKKMTIADIHRQIKIQHEKCRELQALALEKTTKFQQMKKISLRFSKELSTNHTFQELTNEAESLLWEYAWCVYSISPIKEMEIEPDDLKAEKCVEMTLQSPEEESNAFFNLEKPLNFRTVEDCVSEMLQIHLATVGDVGEARELIKIQADVLDDLDKNVEFEFEVTDLDAKEGGVQSNTEISYANDSNAEKDYMENKSSGFYYGDFEDEETLNHRINFLKAFQEMIRLSLRLFKSMNEAWVEPGNTFFDRKLEQIEEEIQKRSDIFGKRFFWDCDEPTKSDTEVKRTGDSKNTPITGSNASPDKKGALFIEPKDLDAATEFAYIKLAALAKKSASNKVSTISVAALNKAS